MWLFTYQLQYLSMKNSFPSRYTQRYRKYRYNEYTIYILLLLTLHGMLTVNHRILKNGVTSPASIATFPLWYVRFISLVALLGWTSYSAAV